MIDQILATGSWIDLYDLYHNRPCIRQLNNPNLYTGFVGYRTHLILPLGGNFQSDFNALNLVAKKLITEKRFDLVEKLNLDIKNYF